VEDSYQRFAANVDKILEEQSRRTDTYGGNSFHHSLQTESS